MSNNDDFKTIWLTALSQIKTDVGEDIFSRWFKLEYSGFSDGGLELTAPSVFHRDKLVKEYGSVIENAINGAAGEKLSVLIKASSDAPTPKTQKEVSEIVAPETKHEKKPKVNVKIDEKTKEDRPHSLLNKDFTFDSYVVGDNNLFAVNASLAVSKNPGAEYNPLFIYSGVGLGKTHLLQAIGNDVYRNSNAKIVYTTAEAFFNDFQDSIGEKSMPDFRKKYRNVNLLLIDDIHFLENKPALQEEIFNTFNALIGLKKQMVFTCDRPISELKHFSERLTSRLGSGLSVDLQMPQYEMRYAILLQKIKERNISIPYDVIDLICKNISTNVRDLVAALNKMVGYADLIKKPVTLEAAQEQLKDVFASPKQSNITIENIQQVVSNHFSLSVSDLKSKKRNKTIVYPRQLAMYITTKLTEYTTTDIGQAFGGRDHATVLHSNRVIEERLQNEPSMERLIQSLMKTVKEQNAK